MTESNNYDFGNLKDRVRGHDFQFNWGRKLYKIKPTAERVLAFHVALREKTEARGGQIAFSGEDVWELAAPLLGGRYVRESGEFTEGSHPDEANNNVIVELLGEGMDFDTLDNLLTTTYLYYQFNPDVAAAYMETGDVGKAFKLVAERKNREENPETETPPVRGETGEDDSAEK